jgi:hypothetical protein
MEIYRLFELEGGLAVRLMDRTRNYYGDFWHVLIDVQCDVEVARVADKVSSSGVDLTALSDKTFVYRRTLEKMGVPSAEVAAVREHLVANFASHSLPYFSSPAFAERFVLAEVRKRQKRAAAGLVALHA